MWHKTAAGMLAGLLAMVLRRDRCGNGLAARGMG
jgi:hypothetical protein